MHISLKVPSALAAIVLLGGCAFSPHLSKRTTPGDLELHARNEPLYHTSYVGSDSKYHYFRREEGLHTSSLKIPVSELSLKQTFPLGHGKPYLVTENIFPKKSPKPGR